MIPGLKAVLLQELRALASPRVWDVEGHLDELPSLTPVRGSVRVEHLGSVLEVNGSLSTIITLCCDRCLGQFNHPLACETRELIWLGQEDCDQAGATVLEGNDQDGLLERLDPFGSFDPQRWAFEQLSLQLPVVNHCGDGCPGPPCALNSLNPAKQAAAIGSEQVAIDPRWETLRKLQSP